MKEKNEVLLGHIRFKLAAVFVVLTFFVFQMFICTGTAFAYEYESEGSESFFERYDSEYQTYRVGQSFELDWDYNSTADLYERIDFKSSKPEVVSVTRHYGECKAKALGTAIITAKYGSYYSISWTIVVKQAKTKYGTYVQNEKFKASCMSELKYVKSKSVKYYSSNKKIMTINPKTGEASFRKSGDVILVCKDKDETYRLPIHVKYKTSEEFKKHVVKKLKSKAWFPSSLIVQSLTQKNGALHIKVSSLNFFKQRVTQKFKCYYSGNTLKIKEL